MSHRCWRPQSSCDLPIHIHFRRSTDSLHCSHRYGTCITVVRECTQNHSPPTIKFPTATQENYPQYVTQEIRPEAASFKTTSHTPRRRNCSQRFTGRVKLETADQSYTARRVGPTNTTPLELRPSYTTREVVPAGARLATTRTYLAKDVKPSNESSSVWSPGYVTETIKPAETQSHRKSSPVVGRDPEEAYGTSTNKSQKRATFAEAPIQSISRPLFEHEVCAPTTEQQMGVANVLAWYSGHIS